MSDNIIDLMHEFEAKQAVQEYYYSTDRDLADFRHVPDLNGPSDVIPNCVHVLQNELTKGFGREPR